MRILLVTPPLTQLNTPYPATAYIAGFLNSKGFVVSQLDLGIELIDRTFTLNGLSQIFDEAEHLGVENYSDIKMLTLRKRYENTIETVINFLRGNDLSIANRIAKRNFLPEGDRFKNIADPEFFFGELGVVDYAKHIATLYIEDISDFIRRNISSHFELIRYAESLCVRLPEFEKLKKQIEKDSNLIDRLILEIFEDKFNSFNPDLVGFSIPFPGNLYGGLICAKWLKTVYPKVKIALGGGYISTELRSLGDTELFKYVDYVIYDDGELPILRLIQYLQGEVASSDLVRTSYIANGNFVSARNWEQNIAKNERVIPAYDDLPLKKYIDMIETANPMLKLWSDGRWNKLILAHGCYWAKCTFCDTSLDYISRFEPYEASKIVDMMEELVVKTGNSGFHFVDEAAPPALLKKLSLEIIRRKINVSWWANIRFEKNFSKDLCLLMAKAGCIAVSGGLEVASDRILKLINKGVDIKQAAIVANSLSSAGIMVHAYLMYGFPSESTQETIDSLEIVRQLFEQNIIHSAFWHRFALTVHSPIASNPLQFGISISDKTSNSFANNEIFFKDKTDTNLDMLGDGLRKATYNYMHKSGFNSNISSWFNGKVPVTTIPVTFIQGCLVTVKVDVIPDNGAYIWIGDGYKLHLTDSRKPKLHLFSSNKTIEIILKLDEIAFWEDFFGVIDQNDGLIDVDLIKTIASTGFRGGACMLISSKVWKTVRKNLLLHV